MTIAPKLTWIALFLLLTLPAQAWSGGAGVTGHHVLSNGLEVRLYPRPSTPLIATLVLVKTGYALETTANRGYSHLLEHLVFAGTPEQDKAAIFREVEGMGGYLNGFTRDDYMGYLMVGHRDHHERQMEVLTDILFRAALDEDALAEAREVVLEEIRRSQSRPQTRVDEMFQWLLYRGSSYARTGLGNERTVSAVSRQEILDHYRKVYRPDNMVLLATGGFTEKATLALLEKTLGRPEPGADAAVVGPPPPVRGRRLHTLRAETPDLQLHIGFNGPDPREEGAEALQLVGAILGGSAGRLRQSLDAKGFQPRSVTAGLAVNPGFSRFLVTASLPANVDPEQALAAVLDEMDSVATKGPTDDELQGARGALVAAEIMGREKLHYELMAKAPWVLAGAPGSAFSEGRWGAFAPGDLQAVSAEYLAGRPYVALVALPGAGNAEGQGGGEAPRERQILGNGLTIVAEQRPDSGLFALHLMTRQRSGVEPAGKAGIADFLHRMLTKGTENRTSAQIETELRGLGASLSTAGNPTVPFGDFYTSRLYSFVRLECLEERAPPAVELLADLIRQARFPSEEVEKVRSEILDYIADREAKPGALGGRLLAEALYGPGPLANHVLGSEGSIESITREDLAEFRENYFVGANLIVTVVSSLSPGEAIDLVSRHFSALPRGEPAPENAPAVTVREVLVERELGKPQGYLSVGAVVATVAQEDRPALAVVSKILNRRLFENLREKEGLAYSIGASLGSVGDMAVFTLSMGTAPAKLEQARSSVRREIETARGMKVSAEDLRRTVNGITGRLQMRTLTSINRAYYLGRAEREGLPHTFGEDYRRELLGLTGEEVEAIARGYLPETTIEVIVR